MVRSAFLLCGLLLMLSVALFSVRCIDGACEGLEGRTYDIFAVANIKPGVSAATLQRRVGRPVFKKDLGDGVQEWRYYWRCERKSWVGAGPLRIRTNRSTVRSEAIIRLKDDRVEKVVQDEPWMSSP